jgi:hypothetical protein
MKISCIEGKEKENVLHPLPHLWGVEHITPTYKTGFLPPPPLPNFSKSINYVLKRSWMEDCYNNSGPNL